MAVARWFIVPKFPLTADADHVPAQLIRLACDSLEGQRALAAAAQAPQANSQAS